jgi:hypothetical protein
LRYGVMVFVLPLEMDEAKYGASLFSSLRQSFEIDKKDILFSNDSYVIDGSLALDELSSRKIVAKLVIFKSISRRKFDNVTSKQRNPLSSEKPVLNDIANIHRGISTGANCFFILNDERAKALKLPNGFLKRIFPPRIPRSRLSEVFTIDNWDALRIEGMPCWLFYVKPDIPMELLPIEVRQYINFGERNGVNKIYTCAKRTKRWYSISLPKTPDIVFTNIYRDYPMFILNQAHLLNLTNLVGMYLKSPKKSAISQISLTNMLNLEVKQWVKSASVGRKYAGGLTNVVPGDLLKMPISQQVLNVFGNTFLYDSGDKAKSCF